ncbi:MAG TPA: hypothetical protein PLY32_05245 [Salinivirgaceae bacterium]|nr:hypothetical protein [Salinivirgaceae bacterium]HQA76507.1 hypothetical protein [Salinivirgaceae bacterium]
MLSKNKINQLTMIELPYSMNSLTVLSSFSTLTSTFVDEPSERVYNRI